MLRNMKYLPISVANEFIGLSPSGETHMKLQKLVYMAYGAWLSENENPFIAESPQVWQYGPVFDSLYHELKNFRSEKINEQQFIIDKTGLINEPEIKALIGRVWEKYKDISGARLSDITHLAGSPWYQIAKENNFRVPLGATIPDDLIKKYFRETANMAV